MKISEATVEINMEVPLKIKTISVTRSNYPQVCTQRVLSQLTVNACTSVSTKVKLIVVKL